MPNSFDKDIMIGGWGSGKTNAFTDIKHFKDFKDFIEYSNNITNFYSMLMIIIHIKNKKVLTTFDDFIADMLICLWQSINNPC